MLYGLSGQAIGPGRYLTGLIGYRLAAKQLRAPERPDKQGLVLQAVPDLSQLGRGRALEDELEELLP